MFQMEQSRVEIHEYTPEWIREFGDIGDTLRSALSNSALRIDHIGSTSIPGLAAKPIIDIQVSVTALEPMDDYRGKIESLGYDWRRDNPQKSKRWPLNSDTTDTSTRKLKHRFSGKSYKKRIAGQQQRVGSRAPQIDRRSAVVGPKQVFSTYPVSKLNRKTREEKVNAIP